ncbi:MAG: glycosyltransferase family 4 protein [Bacteroidetes bacterium]|nr:glycosyltransferase family 4 protein [Bacteroidota bacterium]
MKVAVLAPVAWRTPPKQYGPWEQVASNIAEGLVNNGVDVTLFATADSITTARLDAVVERGYEEDRSMDAKVVECLHISNLMEKASDFDIVHNNFDFLPLTYSGLIRTPMVTTIHGFSSPAILPVYQKYNNTSTYISISNADRSPLLTYAATVYNGIQVNDFQFGEKPQDYLLYFGRIHHDKGTAEAIEIALKAKKRLLIAGLIQDSRYFADKVKPFLNEQIVYVGSAGPKERNELMKNALALLHPINFAEPFGLSVAEAMLCGTPVIAFNRGSMSELIVHERTGFLVANISEAAEAVSHVTTLNRLECRQWSAEQFSQEKMVKSYMEVYKKI